VNDATAKTVVLFVRKSFNGSVTIFAVGKVNNRAN
jgi:hypothetical protein